MIDQNTFNGKPPAKCRGFNVVRAPEDVRFGTKADIT